MQSSTTPMSVRPLRRRATLVASLVTAASLMGIAGPANAAAAASCGSEAAAPTAPGRPQLGRDPITVPDEDGAPLRMYAGLMLPPAVAVDPSTGHVLTALYAADRTVHGVEVDPEQPERATADVRLATADGAPARFDQGHATSSSANGNVNDSANNLTIAIDRSGHVHVAGNVHNSPLSYWRSTEPHEVRSLRNAAKPGAMQGIWIVKDRTGSEVKRYLGSGAELGATSYPDIFDGPDGALFMSWRSGMAGQGNEFLYRFDESTRVWKSVAGSTMYGSYPEGHVLLEGMSSGVSPFSTRPVRFPDGWYWKAWSWRSDSNDPDSNGRISAAKSRDLTTWYSPRGKELPSTIGFSNPDVVVDDLPLQGSGLLNGQVQIGWDSAGLPVVTYFKYRDKDGQRTSQMFAARLPGVSSFWVPQQVSNWSGITTPAAEPPLAMLGGARPDTTGAGEFTIQYSCPGSSEARTAIIDTGAYIGSSQLVSDGWSDTAPEPAASLQRHTDPTKYPQLVPRVAFGSASAPTTWLLGWDSGRYIVDGRAPGQDFPSEGSPAVLYAVDNAPPQQTRAEDH